MFAAPVKRPAGPDVGARKPVPMRTAAAAPPQLGPAPLADARLERDADQAAERLAHLQPDRAAAASPPAPLPPAGAGPAPAMVRDLVRLPGRPLAAPVRSGFEAGFGRDFASVRIHADARADAAAAALGALAFTFGRDIAFRAGRFAPATSAGRTLLAHELAHVVQQSGGTARLQLKDGEPKKKKEPPVEILPIRVYIDGPIDSVELMLEMIKQHFGATSNDEAKAIWRREFPRGGIISANLTQADFDRGYILVQCNHPIIAAQQARRRRYLEEVPASPDANLIPELEKKPRTLQQSASLDELIRQLEAAGKDPANVLDFLSGVLPPENEELDVAGIVTIASKIPEARTLEAWEYKSRTSERTSDLKALGASLDSFGWELSERAADAKDFMQLAQRLAPICGPLYARYRRWKDAPVAPGKSEATTRSDLEYELNPMLAEAGFPGGASELDACVQAFEQAFAKEAARRLDIGLDQFLHLLMIQQERYEKTDAAARLFESVSASGAAFDYQEARQAASASVVASRSETDTGIEEAGSEAVRNRDARNAGDAKVLGAAQGHPLVGQHDFDLRKLAGASDKDAVIRLMLEAIENHRKDIARVKEKLDDPSLIFGNDELFAGSLQAQGIGGVPCLEKLLRDHKDDVEWEDFLEGLALDLLFLVISLIPGGGLVTATIGLAYDAWGLKKAGDAYLLNDALYGAEVTSTPADPTDLIMSTISVGLDVKEVGSGLSALPGIKKTKNLTNSGGGDPDLPNRSVTFDPPKTKVGKEPIDAKSGKSIERGLSPKEKKQLIRQQEKKRKLQAEKDRRKKEKARKKKAADQRSKAIKETGAEASELDQALGIVSLALDGVDILMDLQKICASDEVEEAARKAAEEASAIIAKGRQLGLSDAEAARFAKQRLGGTPAADVEKAMEAAAAAKKKGE
jgi:hypothetical protein